MPTHVARTGVGTGMEVPLFDRRVRPRLTPS